ncbi:dehydrogenase/reductase SDR family member 4-like [Aegotheles albertisi]
MRGNRGESGAVKRGGIRGEIGVKNGGPREDPSGAERTRRGPERSRKDPKRTRRCPKRTRAEPKGPERSRRGPERTRAEPKGPERSRRDPERTRAEPKGPEEDPSGAEGARRGPERSRKDPKRTRAEPKGPERSRRDPERTRAEPKGPEEDPSGAGGTRAEPKGPREDPSGAGGTRAEPKVPERTRVEPKGPERSRRDPKRSGKGRARADRSRGDPGVPQGTQASGKGTQASGGPLAGKVAVVTASTDGIGLAVAVGLGRAGARVVVSSRRAPHVEAAVGQLRSQGLEVSGVVCHVGQPHSRERLINKAVELYGGLDILVSNAATNPHLGPTLELDEATWGKIFQVNVTAAAMLVGLALPHMERRGGGVIVLVSSLAGYRPFPALGPYSVSKTALLGLVKALGAELRPRGVRVNGVAPGLIRTRFSAALWQDAAVREQVMSSLGITRLGTPEDVAEVVTFLCSPGAEYLSGETLVVAGGAPSRL